MFERLKKLWKMTVTWFRPESRSTPLIIPVQAPKFRAHAESTNQELHREKVHANPEASPASAPHQPQESQPQTEEDEGSLARLIALETKLKLTPLPGATMSERLDHAHKAIAEALKKRPTNRAQRRQLERARRRHDKFVEPQGPAPIQSTAPPRPPRPNPKLEELPPAPDQFDDPNDLWIVDEWLEGSGDKVLFEQSEFWGEYNFRDTILDQLERYWVYLARMKKHDKDAYAFYKILGATLIPYSATHTRRTTPLKFHKLNTEELDHYRSEISLPPWFRTHWPSFGCVAFGTNPVDEESEMKTIDGMQHFTPKFLYFRALRSVPWMVQPVVGGHVYVLTVWWDKPQDKKHPTNWGVPGEYPFHISDDGKTIRALKTRKHSDGSFGPWWDWEYPDKEWAVPYGIDIQTHLTHIFCHAVQEIEQASYSTLRIEVSKGDMSAIFGVPPNRTSYFFQDRDILLTESGRRRRVFHFVRPHIRKDGSAIKAHFRGLREFTWANYKVRITVPGLDHFMPQEFNPKVIWDSSCIKEKVLTEEQVAERLKKHITQGWQFTCSQQPKS